MADLGRWGFAVSRDDLDDAAAIERLGFDTLWLPGGQISSTDVVLELLAASERAVVATAILSGSVYAAEDVVALRDAADRSSPGRAVLGIGGPQARRSLAAVEELLDQLAEAGVRSEELLLAALGPRKLEIAARRTAGPILLLVTPAFLRDVRERVGDATVVVQLPAVLDVDAGRARDAARGMLGFLTGLPGYRAHLGRIGFSEEDVDRLPDDLVDKLVAHGSPAAVRERAAKYLEAGADHVFVQPVGTDQAPTGLAAARLLSGGAAQPANPGR